MVRLRRDVAIQHGSGPLEIGTAGGTQEPVVADLGKAPWENMLEESREERVHRERHAPRLLGARVGVAEGDAAVGKPFQPVVGERDVIDIAREVVRRVCAAADRLHVDRPGFRPHAGIDHAAEASAG